MGRYCPNVFLGFQDFDVPRFDLSTQSSYGQWLEIGSLGCATRRSGGRVSLAPVACEPRCTMETHAGPARRRSGVRPPTW